jgi:hypothetical protein
MLKYTFGLSNENSLAKIFTDFLMIIRPELLQFG